jgi:transcription elongation factor GreA
MNKSPKYFSEKGFQKYKYLVKEQEKKVADTSIRMGIASEDGGMHENSAFEEALQATNVEDRLLKEMKEVIENAVIYTPIEQDKTIQIGSTVSYVNEDTGEIKEITVGAFGELDLKLKIFTYESPVAQALLGKKVGDVSVVSLAGQSHSIKVKNIYPPSHVYWSILESLYSIGHSKTCNQGV